MNNKLLSKRLSLKHRMFRLLWKIVYIFFFRPIPRSYFNNWKIFLLRIFGARISQSALIYNSTIIYDPSKLIMDENSCLGPDVDCYNVDYVHLKENSIVSQKTYLCTASHDFENEGFNLITAPIVIEKNVWVAADSFIGMGVTVGENSVVGARSSVFKNVPANVVVGGNPAKVIRQRSS